jgi:hypothetical protein
MSHSGPFFYAWCPDEERFAAYSVAMSALVTSSSYDQATKAQLLDDARTNFEKENVFRDCDNFRLLSGDAIVLDVTVWRDSYEYAGNSGPIVLQPEDQFDLLFLKMPMARGGSRSVEIESAIFTIVTFENTIDLLQRLCVPDQTSRVTTGACAFGVWESPLDACITYHADANVARDLATAWLNGYDQSSAVKLAGLGLPELRARITTAPAPQAQVAQASMVEYIDNRSVIVPRWSGPNWSIEFPPPAAYELTREQVLAALDVPTVKLREALEAAAAPDSEWQAVEAIARNNIEAKRQGAPCDDVWVNTRPHLRFLEQHAPFQVRHLQNGGVMLATHPYRTLWPLWAKALDLLGIRPLTR